MAFSYMKPAICLAVLHMVLGDPFGSPFLPNVPGQQWKRVGHLDMTDPAQQCPDTWLKFTSPRASCGKKNSALCESVNI